MSSEHNVEVVRVTDIQKHPNADSLSIALIHGGYPVIFRTGDYTENSLAVYVPVDSVVPADDPRWEFLAGHTRIRAKRLRGVFSMGLLTPADPEWTEGQDVATALRITEYTPPPPRANGPGNHCTLESSEAAEHDPGYMPKYTDIESIRKYGSKLFTEGETVVVMEKLHGENARYTYADSRLYVGSRTQIKSDTGNSRWWKAAQKYDLATRLAAFPDYAFYGECHGYTGGFPYGVPKGEADLRLFDIYDRVNHRYLDAYDLIRIADIIGVPTAPVLYIGPWSNELRAMAEGQSTLDASHVREGIVVRPERERVSHHGRTILKLHGEGFLLSKHT